ncbi:MAG: twin-arginine translocation signal domain-containing protein [Planctomycetota bacterium]|nr:twin-arginine translocation signal domain-containing protein [Planctomycetota bacterium]
MSESKGVTRRNFLGGSLAAAGAMGLAASAVGVGATPARAAEATPAPTADAAQMPCGMLGKAKISRMMVGGNLISGYTHSRDLKYVNQLFKAYVTEEKVLQTLKLAESYGINTVFETGGNFVQRYNKEMGGHMQFIPHIEIKKGQSETDLLAHIQKQVDTGAVALYVWGVAADTLMRDGDFDLLKRAVDLAKAHELPVGVGSHSLLVPMACEKAGVACDFYVKTFHRDDYPSATPKELRKEFIWLNGGKGWYDNMWCINPEETAEFMKTVKKPWVAFKILAAGAISPRVGFAHAFDNGADFVAVGIFDFQVKEDCGICCDAVANAQKRQRPWRA